jgi:DNA-binding response OmpR family regulator
MKRLEGGHVLAICACGVWPISCIVVVEDEFLVRMMVVEALADAGFEVIEAASGDAAIALLGSDSVQLVITDINLRGSLDGIAVARAARTHRPSMPIIFMSGRPSKLTEARVLDHPAVFLQKPFTMSQLVNDVRRFVEA